MEEDKNHFEPSNKEEPEEPEEIEDEEDQQVNEKFRKKLEIQRRILQRFIEPT